MIEYKKSVADATDFWKSIENVNIAIKDKIIYEFYFNYYLKK